jgi:flagellin-specific chaperone FliS
MTSEENEELLELARRTRDDFYEHTLTVIQEMSQREKEMNFKDFHQIDESILAVLDPLIGQQVKPKPFTVTDMVTALQQANIDKDPGKVKKAIGMLSTLIDYVKLLSDGKAEATIKGIKSVQQKLDTALKELEGQS